MSMARDDRTGQRSHAADFMSGGRGDSTRVFRTAQRHSRRVRFLRVAVPISVVICLVVIAAASYLNPLKMLARLPTDFGTLVVSGTKITMEAPRLAGVTRDSRAYEVTASAAAQDIAKPELVELKNIRAKLDMQDKSVMQLTALGGLFNAKTETLNLGPDIVLSSSTGYEGRLSEALIDIRKGNIVSRKPVEVKMLKGTLNANNLEVIEAGDVVRFDGGVTMTLKLDGGDYPQASTGAAQ
jgi:lipopolysaccharide export system protein LptC